MVNINVSWIPFIFHEFFSQINQMVALLYERNRYLGLLKSGRWLYVIIMSRTSFRVNLHSIVAWMSRKEAPYLKFKWQQRDSNPRPLSLLTNTQPFSQTGRMIKLCCEYLSVRCIWLYVIISLCNWIWFYRFVSEYNHEDWKITNMFKVPDTILNFSKSAERNFCL